VHKNDDDFYKPSIIISFHEYYAKYKRIGNKRLPLSSTPSILQYALINPEKEQN